MKRSVYRSLVRLQSYVEADLAKRVDQYCADHGLSESALIKTSLSEYMDDSGDATLILRRLDRLGRALERIHRDLGILLDAVSVFVEVWFVHTPRVPDAGKRAAQQSGESRYREYLARVVQRFTGGPRFLDDLPREALADDGELSSIADGRSEPASAKASQTP